MSDKKYFHKIDDVEWETMCDNKLTWFDLKKIFKAPDWCAYGNTALDPLGCWSLINRMVKNEDYCKKCDGNHNYMIDYSDI
jgi:hypothetical protein